MPLGTLDRTPPPFFRQGLSAFSKLLLFSGLALFLMAADARFKLTQPLRNALATVLMPVQQVMRMPMQAWDHAGTYLGGLDAAQRGEDRARARLAEQAERSGRTELWQAENARLRALLGLRPSLVVKSQAAEVLYEAPDPYSFKYFIDRGSSHGIQPGSPVINEAGVLGQVSRAYLLMSEVVLLSDKEFAIPVLNTRTQHRGAAFGSGEDGVMELRFVAANDDVQVGDLLSTSGVDGVYPPGLPVARVTQVDRHGDAGFARITLVPAAASDGVRHLLVLEPIGVQQPPRPEPPPVVVPARGAKGGKR